MVDLKLVSSAVCLLVELEMLLSVGSLDRFGMTGFVRDLEHHQPAAMRSETLLHEPMRAMDWAMLFRPPPWEGRLFRPRPDDADHGQRYRLRLSLANSRYFAALTGCFHSACQWRRPKKHGPVHGSHRFMQQGAAG